MSKHSAHTIDNYLDDNDFIMLTNRIFEYMKKHGYSTLDFAEEYDETTMEVIVDFIADFVETEACDDFGWKYGEQAPINRYVPTAEKMYEKIKSMMQKNKTKKQTIKLDEKTFKKIVTEAAKRILKENESIPFEELYDKIQDVTNETMNFCAPMSAQGERDEKTQQLMDELSEIANRFSNVAHELEEHLAWD